MCVQVVLRKEPHRQVLTPCMFNLTDCTLCSQSVSQPTVTHYPLSIGVASDRFRSNRCCRRLSCESEETVQLTVNTCGRTHALNGGAVFIYVVN